MPPRRRTRPRQHPHDFQCRRLTVDGRASRPTRESSSYCSADVPTRFRTYDFVRRCSMGVNTYPPPWYLRVCLLALSSAAARFTFDFQEFRAGDGWNYRRTG